MTLRYQYEISYFKGTRTQRVSMWDVGPLWRARLLEIDSMGQVVSESNTTYTGPRAEANAGVVFQRYVCAMLTEAFRLEGVEITREDIRFGVDNRPTIDGMDAKEWLAAMTD